MAPDTATSGTASPVPDTATSGTASPVPDTAASGTTKKGAKLAFPKAARKAAARKRKTNQVLVGGEDEDPNDYVNLLPENIQSHLATITSEKERTDAINTYLNGRLACLGEEKQAEIMKLPSLAERVTAVLVDDSMDES